MRVNVDNSRKTVAKLLCVAMLLLHLAAEMNAQVSSGRKPGIGVGAYPVSFTLASAWFATQSDKDKVLRAMVYIKGRPGWHRETTDYRWDINSDPATINMTVGGKKLVIQYHAAANRVHIQGRGFSLHDVNVFLLDGIDDENPAILPFGVHDLSFRSEDIPATRLLMRNPEVWHKLSGLPREEHAEARRKTAPAALIDGDRRGLELLDSNAKAACEAWRQAAIAGYAPSQYRLGYCYESGHGVEVNESTANDWYRKAADQGHLDAQYKLGHSYRVGRGAKVDLVEARRWYKMAAENGDPDAMHNYAWMSATGQGTAADSKQAYEWFLRAARHGDAAAQFETARRLREGDGTPKDMIHAVAWLLVLEAQSKEFPPEEWKKVQAILDELKIQIDAHVEAARKRAQTYMGEIAANALALLGRKGI